MQIFLVFALIIAFVSVAFALQNTAVVDVSFLVWHFQGSLALVLFLALAAGALISLFASLPTLIKGHWEVTSQKRRVAELEARLEKDKEKQLSAVLHAPHVGEEDAAV